MKRILFLTVSVVFIFCFFTLNVSAEILGNIYGKVIDKETKEPLKKTYIAFDNLYRHDRKISTYTNEKGEFYFEKVPAEIPLELHIYILSHPSYPNFEYYEHVKHVEIFIKKGTNLYLKPIEIEKGVKVTGTVKLWDGTPIYKADIDVRPLKSQKDEFLSNGGITNENGIYTSMPLPTNIDLRFEVSHLFSSDGKICYGNVTKIFKIEKGKPTDNFNIVIPNIPTEIKGLVTDFNNNPISNQKIRFSSDDLSSLRIKTDSNGKFIFRYIPPTNFQIIIPYKKNDSLLFFETKKIELNNDESIEFLINLNSSDFRYTIVRKSFSK